MGSQGQLADSTPAILKAQTFVFRGMIARVQWIWWCFYITKKCKRKDIASTTEGFSVWEMFGRTYN
jgi:hypothetical protein